MENVFLGLGANLGNPYNNILRALELIGSIKNVKGIKSSSFYKTSPVSCIKQEDYLNLVCHIQTDLEPTSLLEELKKIETDIGKIPKKKDEPRLIDIDILFFGTRSIHIDSLTIPHPRWQERLFVLIPLQEICPTILLPEGNTIDLEKLIEQFSSKEPQIINLFNPKDTHEDCLYC